MSLEQHYSSLCVSISHTCRYKHVDKWLWPERSVSRLASINLALGDIDNLTKRSLAVARLGKLMARFARLLRRLVFLQPCPRLADEKAEVYDSRPVTHPPYALLTQPHTAN